MAAYYFTPWHCLMGGLALGIVSAGKTLLSSRILGISGSIKGLLAGDFSSWRLLFLGGMAAGAAAVANFLPGAIEAFPESFSLTRAAIGGLLVGAGSALGNGCTSGHGISGNSRLSVRSLVYTLTFMIAGAIAVSLTSTTAALGLPQARPAYLPLQGLDLYRGGAILGIAAVGTQALGWMTQIASPKTVSLVYEAVCGITFSLALGFTGMVKPSKVASFLAFLEPAWNASLAFVMGGALLIATPMMYLIQKRKQALDGSLMALPSSKDIDAPLLLGGILFGSGWGICGMCPGPMIVALAQPSQHILVIFVSMLFGMGIGMFLKPKLLPATAHKAA